MFTPVYLTPQCRKTRKYPERRWERARYLREHGRRPSSVRDDALVWRAWRFQQAESPGQTRPANHYLQFPDITLARSIRTDVESLRHAEVQARLLADESDAVIAAKCGIDPTTVATYHGLFFHVRPFLHDSRHILKAVFDEENPYLSAEPARRGDLLMWFGYAVGGQAVDALVASTAGPRDAPAAPRHFDAAGLPSLLGKLRVKAVLDRLRPGHLTLSGWMELQRIMSGQSDHTLSLLPGSDGQDLAQEEPTLLHVPVASGRDRPELPDDTDEQELNSEDAGSIRSEFWDARQSSDEPDDPDEPDEPMCPENR